MSILQRYDNDGIELIINTQTGESFATISGYARMAGISQQAVSKRYNGTHNEAERKSAEIQTPQGIRTHNLINGKLAMRWLAKDNPELLVAMGEVGWNVYCHKMAGYEVKSTAVQPTLPETYLDALKALVKAEEQKVLMAAQNAQLQKENEALSEAVDELFEYSSIIRVAKFNKVHEKAFEWRKLKAASDAMGLEVKRVPCPRFEWKNLYSHDAWRFCYPEMKLPETTTLVIRH